MCVCVGREGETIEAKGRKDSNSDRCDGGELHREGIDR